MTATHERHSEAAIRDVIAKENVKFIDLQFIDILGIVKSAPFQMAAK